MDKELERIRKEFSKYSFISSPTPKNIFYKKRLKENFIYIVGPLLSLIFVLIFKPVILSIKDDNKEGEEVKYRINFFRLFIFVLLIGGLIDLIIYFILKRTKSV